jgi:hypothetical protein
MDPLGLLLAPSLAKPFENVEPVSKRGYDRSHAIGGIGARHCGRKAGRVVTLQPESPGGFIVICAWRSCPRPRGSRACIGDWKSPESLHAAACNRQRLALLVPDWWPLVRGTRPFAPLNLLPGAFDPPATCTRITLHTRASSMQSSKLVRGLIRPGLSQALSW